jgi:CRISPR/Cas system-associated exonuclease Cas4 (RecB family)
MGRSKLSTWRSRASGLGAYLLCDARAAFDRAIEEGLLVLEPVAQATVAEAKKSSPYADFGTCAHFHLQDGLGCRFPADSKLFAPTPDELENAAGLFSGDTAVRDDMIRQVALLAARHMPAAPDGKPWLSEHKYEMPDIQGHIDFVSQDSSVIVDLKTTSRPPDNNRPKPEHIVQLCAYYLLVEHKTGVKPKKGVLLYVSSQAQWALSCELDFTDQEMLDYIDSIAKYARYLRSKHLYEFATPRIGKHCSDNWCPYRAICKDKVMPPSGTLVEGTTKAPVVKVSAIFGAKS